MPLKLQFSEPLPKLDTRDTYLILFDEVKVVEESGVYILEIPLAFQQRIVAKYTYGITASKVELRLANKELKNETSQDVIIIQNTTTHTDKKVAGAEFKPVVKFGVGEGISIEASAGSVDVKKSIGVREGQTFSNKEHPLQPTVYKDVIAWNYNPIMKVIRGYLSGNLSLKASCAGLKENDEGSLSAEGLYCEIFGKDQISIHRKFSLAGLFLLFSRGKIRNKLFREFQITNK